MNGTISGDGLCTNSVSMACPQPQVTVSDRCTLLGVVSNPVLLTLYPQIPTLVQLQ